MVCRKLTLNFKKVYCSWCYCCVWWKRAVTTDSSMESGLSAMFLLLTGSEGVCQESCVSDELEKRAICLLV